MRRGIIIVIMLAFVLMASPPGVSHGTTIQSELDQAVHEQLEALDVQQVEKMLMEIEDEVNQYIPELSFSDFVENLKNGEINLNPKDAINGLLGFLGKEVLANIGLMGKLVFLAVLCAILGNFGQAFQSNSVNKLANMVVLLVVIILTVSSLEMVMELGRRAIEQMVSFMHLLTPVLLTLLVAMGGITTTAIMHPFILFMLNLVSTLFGLVIFPLIYLEAVLKIVNNISGDFKVDKLAGLLNGATKTLIGFTFTVFLGTLSIQGVGGGVADGISLRTAKYMTDAFIPVVGGMLSKVLETVIGGSVLIKNGLGIVGLLAILAITVIPAVKIFVVYLVYKFSAALIQPLGDNKIATTIGDLAGSLKMVFAAVVSVAVMFFLAIVIIVSTANFTVMLR